MTDDMRNLREADGTLTYRYGVILNYLFRVDQLCKTLDCSLPLHRAFKKVACLTADGTATVKPEQPNGYKLETLVLDMVHMQENCLLYEVEREKEFAPVKNATGVETAWVPLKQEKRRHTGKRLSVCCLFVFYSCGRVSQSIFRFLK